jgi:hypothetical protein
MIGLNMDIFQLGKISYLLRKTCESGLIGTQISQIDQISNPSGEFINWIVGNHERFQIDTLANPIWEDFNLTMIQVDGMNLRQVNPRGIKVFQSLPREIDLPLTDEETAIIKALLIRLLLAHVV